MDLLSVVMHEFGHVLGLDHSGNGGNNDNLMSATLDAGERLVPAYVDSRTEGVQTKEVMVYDDMSGTLATLENRNNGNGKKRVLTFDPSQWEGVGGNGDTNGDWIIEV
jgi:hypothetical protein